MSLQVNLQSNIEQEEKQTVKVQVPTSAIDIDDITFHVKKRKGHCTVSYGDIVDDEFVAKKVETWFLSGDFYLGKIAVDVNGVLNILVLQNVAGTVTSIITSPELKQQLLDSGELEIAHGDIFEPLRQFGLDI